MNAKKMLKKIYSTECIIVWAIFTIVLFKIHSSMPTIAKILAGVMLIGIPLVIFLEMRTKKDILRELEERIGWPNFQTAKVHLRYWNSFNIDIDDKCPESIKKEVLKYFKDIGFECKIK